MRILLDICGVSLVLLGIIVIFIGIDAGLVQISGFVGSIPFFLQAIVFYGIERVLDTAEKNRKLLTELVAQKREAVVEQQSL
jgi:hypothetical protein